MNLTQIANQADDLANRTTTLADDLGPDVPAIYVARRVVELSRLTAALAEALAVALVEEAGRAY